MFARGQPTRTNSRRAQLPLERVKSFPFQGPPPIFGNDTYAPRRRGVFDVRQVVAYRCCVLLVGRTTRKRARPANNASGKRYDCSTQTTNSGGQFPTSRPQMPATRRSCACRPIRKHVCRLSQKLRGTRKTYPETRPVFLLRRVLWVSRTTLSVSSVAT